jgi:hypothetical protein
LSNRARPRRESFRRRGSRADALRLRKRTAAPRLKLSVRGNHYNMEQTSILEPLPQDKERRVASGGAAKELPIETGPRYKLQERCDQEQPSGWRPNSHNVGSSGDSVDRPSSGSNIVRPTMFPVKPDQGTGNWVHRVFTNEVPLEPQRHDPAVTAGVALGEPNPLLTSLVKAVA